MCVCVCVGSGLISSSHSFFLLGRASVGTFTKVSLSSTPSTYLSQPLSFSSVVFSFNSCAGTRYEFDLVFEMPVTYPLTSPEVAIRELEGKTAKMYRGGKIGCVRDPCCYHACAACVVCKVCGGPDAPHVCQFNGAL